MTNDKTFMPAQPFTYKIYGYIDDSGKGAFYKIPVVAWHLKAESYRGEESNIHLYAFAACHSDDGDQWNPQRNEAILYPCGTVVCSSGGGTYASIAQWIELNTDQFEKQK